MRTLPYLLVAVGLLTGCPTSTTETGDTSGGKDTNDSDTATGDSETGGETGDSETGSSAETGFGAYGIKGSWEVAQGTLQSGSYGYYLVGPDFTTTQCEAVAPVDTVVGPAGCPACDWSYEFTLGAAEVDGSGCDHFDTSWAADMAGTDMKLGFASYYTFHGYYADYYDYNAVLGYYYYDYYGTIYSGWYEIAYLNADYGSYHEVNGDASAGDFTASLAGYVYYFY